MLLCALLSTVVTVRSIHLPIQTQRAAGRGEIACPGLNTLLAPAARQIGRDPYLRAHRDVVVGTEEALRGGGDRAPARISIAYPILITWLYVLSVAFAIPSLPKLLNVVINGKNAVTPASQMAYSTLLAIDSGFTLLTNNLWCSLSDRYGRKPFMAMSSAGIGIGALIVARSSLIWPMYIAATVDGLTSCMLGLGQAYVTDIVAAKVRTS